MLYIYVRYLYKQQIYLNLEYLKSFFAQNIVPHSIEAS